MTTRSKTLKYAAVLLILAGVFTATALAASQDAGDCDQTMDKTQTRLKIQDPTTCTQNCCVDCDGTPDRLRDGSCRLT
jgi:hypothetical protein